MAGDGQPTVNMRDDAAEGSDDNAWGS